MSPFRYCIRYRRIALELILLLFIFVLREQAASQAAGHGIDIRVGEGSSMTNSGLKSVYLSRPVYWFTDRNSFVAVYVDESVILSGDWKRPDAFVGSTSMVQFELAHDMPRLCIEAGVGLNLATTHEIDGRQLGSNLLFSPTLSAGVEVPWMNGLLGVFYLFRHFSNAGMFDENDGVNFQYVVFSLKFNGL